MLTPPAHQSPSPLAGNPPARREVWALLAAAAFLYFCLFVPLGVPIYIGGDETIYLWNTMSMLHGQVLYHDIQLTSAGTNMVYLAAFNLFGVRAWIPNGTLLVFGLALVWLSARISRKLLLTGWAAFLPGFLFLTLAFRNGLEATHHWFRILCITAALALLVEGRTPWRVACAGTLCGLAAGFSQGHGLMAASAIGLFVAWEARRQFQTWRKVAASEFRLFASSLATLLPLDAYFAW
jgi:hypothetical protein